MSFSVFRSFRANPSQKAGCLSKQFRLLRMLLVVMLPAQLFAAEVYFYDVYKGSGGPYGEQDQNITISAATKLAGSDFRFISLNPQDVNYSGNNVPGFFTYKDGNGNVQSIRGVVSRSIKSGSTYQAVYFYVSDNNNVALGDAFLLVFPGFESLFPGSGSIKTSSDPVDAVLNGLLDSQKSPAVTVSPASFTAFTSCAGSPSATQTISVSGSNLTAGIAVTAPIGYEVSLSPNTGFGNAVSISLPSGSTSISATNVYVRLSATAANGASGNVVCTSSGAVNVSIPTGNAVVSDCTQQDRDKDGVPDANDLDNDNDGILDAVEQAACSPAALSCDTDGDGIPNYLDLDSDGDGIADVIEANGSDLNGDGRADGTVDAHGVPSSATGGLQPTDLDTDGHTNPYDTDSDGDTIPDNREAQSAYVAPKGTDADGDGLDDAYDTDKGGTALAPVDTDGDGKPDYQDLDSDNDGIPDVDEAGNPANPVDTDQDNKPDYRDQDSNSDGIPDGETLLIYKSSSAPRLLTDGTYEVRFSITVKNYRDQPLTNVQVKDNLSLTFISPVQYKVVSYTVSGTSLLRNTGFDGKTNTDLLASGSTLPANGIDSIQLVVNIDPKGYSGALNNTAIGTAVSKWGSVTRESIDLSLSNGVRHGNGIASRFTLAPIDLVIPDVITPNGDGFNDRWVIRHPSTLQLAVTVFNRWGQEVYKNSDYANEWDGRGSGSFLGKNLPNGTYFYVVELIEITTGQKEIRKGALTLKRPY